MNTVEKPSTHELEVLVVALGIVNEFLADPEKAVALYGFEGDDRDGKMTCDRAIGYVNTLTAKGWWVVREARVAWLKFGMSKWEEVLGKIALSDAGPNLPAGDIQRELGVYFFTLESRLVKDDVGVGRNDLIDRLLNILKSMRDKQVGDSKILKMMAVRLLKRRTGCEREKDPYQDTLAFQLLLKNYGFHE